MSATQTHGFPEPRGKIRNTTYATTVQNGTATAETVLGKSSVVDQVRMIDNFSTLAEESLLYQKDHVKQQKSKNDVADKPDRKERGKVADIYNAVRRSDIARVRTEALDSAYGKTKRKGNTPAQLEKFRLQMEADKAFKALSLPEQRHRIAENLWHQNKTIRVYTAKKSCGYADIKVGKTGSASRYLNLCADAGLGAVTRLEDKSIEFLGDVSDMVEIMAHCRPEWKESLSMHGRGSGWPCLDGVRLRPCRKYNPETGSWSRLKHSYAKVTAKGSPKVNVPAPRLVCIEPNPGPLPLVFSGGTQFPTTIGGYVLRADLSLGFTSGTTTTATYIWSALNNINGTGGLPDARILPAGTYNIAGVAQVSGLSKFWFVSDVVTSPSVAGNMIGPGTGPASGDRQCWVPIKEVLIDAAGTHYEYSLDLVVNVTDSSCAGYIVACGVGIGALSGAVTAYLASYAGYVTSVSSMPAVTTIGDSNAPVYILNPPSDYVSVGTGTFGGIPIPLLVTGDIGVGNTPLTTFDVRAIGSANPTDPPVAVGGSLIALAKVGVSASSTGPVQVEFDLSAPIHTITDVSGCVGIELCSSAPLPVSVTAFAPQDNPLWCSPYRTSGAPIIGGTPLSLLNAMAEANNAATHSLNGNIVTYIKGSPDPVSVAIDAAWLSIDPRVIWNATLGTQLVQLIANATTESVVIGDLAFTAQYGYDPAQTGVGFNVFNNIILMTAANVWISELYSYETPGGLKPIDQNYEISVGSFIMPPGTKVVSIFTVAGYNTAATYGQLNPLQLKSGSAFFSSGNSTDVNIVGFARQTAPLWTSAYDPGRRPLDPTNASMHALNGNIIYSFMSDDLPDDMTIPAFISSVLTKILSTNPTQNIITHDVLRSLTDAFVGELEPGAAEEMGFEDGARLAACESLTKLLPYTNNLECDDLPVDDSPVKRSRSKSPPSESAVKVDDDDTNKVGVRGKSKSPPKLRPVAHRLAKALSKDDGTLDWDRVTRWVYTRKPKVELLRRLVSCMRTYYPICTYNLSDADMYTGLDLEAGIQTDNPVFHFLWACSTYCSDTSIHSFLACEGLRRFGLTSVGRYLLVPTTVISEHQRLGLELYLKKIVDVPADPAFSPDWQRMVAPRPSKDVASTSVLEVEADQHNAEMHSTNGNIDHLDLSKAGKTTYNMSHHSIARAEGTVHQEEERTDSYTYDRPILTATAEQSRAILGNNAGYAAVEAANRNRKMHSLNGNTTTVTSAASSSLPNLYDFKSIMDAKDIADFVGDATIGDKYLNHHDRVLASMNAYGAIQGVRRAQTSKNMGISRVVATSTLPLIATGSSVATPVSPLKLRGSTPGGGVYASAAFPMTRYGIQKLNGLGYSVKPSAYSERLIDKANTTGVTARISSVDPSTLFNFNDEVTIAADTAGCERFNPEMIAAKMYVDCARLTLIQPDAQYGDTLVGAASPVPTSWDLNNSFINNRTQWPAAEQYGYTVGTNVAIGATAVCGSDATFSIHTNIYTALSSRPATGETVIPIQVNLRLLNALGPNKAGKVLAILGAMIAPHPIIPVGYRVADNSSTYTHNLEGVFTPGQTEIRFYLPQNPRSTGIVPGSVQQANTQAYIRPQFGPCPTLNGINPWAGVGAFGPAAASYDMNYISLDDPNSEVYNLTALWASYMNSQDPITLQDMLNVLLRVEACVPILSCMKFVAQLLDSQTWLIKPLQLTSVPSYPTNVVDVARVRYDNTYVPNPLTAAATPAFSLYDTLLKPFSRMLSGHMIPANADERWASSMVVSERGATGVFDGPISFGNQFFPMYGWATFMAHACASQMLHYLVGRNGAEINLAATAYTGLNPKVIAFARTLDASQLGLDAGINSETQVGLRISYAAATRGCKTPQDLAGQSLFGRRYIDFQNVVGVYPNPTFIPATLGIADCFFWLGEAVKEWAPFPQADILNKSIYLPMGRDFGVLVCPARNIGAASAAFLYRKSMLANFQTPATMDAEPWTDGTDMYNQDLWAAQYPANTVGTLTTVGGVAVTPQNWLYTAPFVTQLGGLTSAVEARALWPRISGNQYVVLVAGAQANNDFAIISDYAQQVNQPRATWQLTPPAYRPSAVYSVGDAMPSILSKLVAKHKSAGVSATGVPDKGDPLGALVAIVTNGNIPVTGTTEAIGVAQISDVVTNSGAVAAGSGGAETVSGLHGYPTLDGRQH